MTPPHAITLRELAFVRDVLIPRAWVQGAEVDELTSLRSRIGGIFAAVQAEQASAPQPPPIPPEQPPSEQPPSEQPPPGRMKKPRHPKRRRGQAPPDGS